ncbi:FAD-dependent monooxygenase [Dactylosporangium sp. NPDC051485]|uniref:FAD-dependent monooxygenase n=1 Tax=Dactylosporangium sp. NPDC051485 TaxID=3154846 RepID=UPI003421D076
MSIDVAIVGAGIGGLTAALAIPGRCTVLERAPAPAADGFGIQLPPNATRALAALGLGPALAAASVRPVARELRRWRDGALIGRIPLGVEVQRRYGAPYLAMRRADLVRVLFDALAPGTVRFGAHCVAAAPDGTLSLAGGATVRAGLVVGADGLRSAVRGALAGPGDAARPIGLTAFRAVLPVADPAPVVTVWLGPGRHVVAYPVPGGLNVVAVTAGPLDGAFDGWHAPVRDMVRAAGAAAHEIRVRPALPAWHRGRLVVLGDAAHPMPPFIAQGAAQAIEDAAALASTLDDLTAFEAARRPRAERIAAASTAGGVEHHLPDGAEQRRRDQRIAASGLPDQDWLYCR